MPQSVKVESDRYLLSSAAPVLVCWLLSCSLIDLGNNFSSFSLWSVSAVKSGRLCIVKQCLESWNKFKLIISESKQEFYLIGRSFCCIYAQWLAPLCAQCTQFANSINVAEIR